MNKIVVLLDVMPCSFVGSHQYFGETAFIVGVEQGWALEVPPNVGTYRPIHHLHGITFQEDYDINFLLS
jgi:hypothetical protein